MILVSIGIDGNNVIKDLNLKNALQSSGGYYSSRDSVTNLLGSIITELRGLENRHINKALTLARSSTTPDNAVKKVRNIIEIYKNCMDFYMERNLRFKSGEEDIKEIIKSYFSSEEGKNGFLPLEPVKICSYYYWNRLKKYNIKQYEDFKNVPRILHIEIGKDFSVGDARLFSINVTLGYSSEDGPAKETFTEISKHTINFSMERIEN